MKMRREVGKEGKPPINRGAFPYLTLEPPKARFRNQVRKHYQTSVQVQIRAGREAKRPSFCTCLTEPQAMEVGK